MINEILKIKAYGPVTIVLEKIDLGKQWPYKQYRIVQTMTDDATVVEYEKIFENNNNNVDGRHAAESFFDGYVACYENF